MPRWSVSIAEFLIALLKLPLIVFGNDYLDLVFTP